MGNPRPKPERLAEKLLQVRNALAISQTEMLKLLGLEESMRYTRISEYELGLREPSLITLLRYARAAGVYVEDLIDDELDLPDQLPGTVKYEGIKHKATPRSKKR